MLAVFEAIAAEQPIGASALARLLEADKSAVQRSIVTLANAGWIAPTIDRPVRWELTTKLFSLAHLPRGSEDLRRRARSTLEDLRNDIGETAFLAIPDQNGFVIIDVAESRHMLRMAPRIGEPISASQRATSRAVLPYYDPEMQHAMLGREPTATEMAEFATSREQGYGTSVSEVLDGATTLASPIFDHQGRPVAAIGITGPCDRLPTERHGIIGKLLSENASRISQAPGT